MLYSLYGRLTGRTGKEHTVTGAKDGVIKAQLETPDAAILIYLDSNGDALVEVGRKQSGKARPERWRNVTELNINDFAKERCTT